MVPLVWHGPGGAARRKEAAAAKSLVIKLPKKPGLVISVQAMNRAIAMYWQAAAAQTYT